MSSNTQARKASALDFDRDKNKKYLPKDESIEPPEHKAKVASGILSAIEMQHNEMRSSIKFMRSQRPDVDKKMQKLGSFVDMMRAHAEAEETTLYEFLQEDSASQVMTFEAIEEHAMAKILMDELESMNFRSRWSNEIEAKANVLMELMEHHMKDEEKELFPHARRLLTDGEREILGREFLRRYEYIQSEKDAIQHLVNPNDATHTL